MKRFPLLPALLLTLIAGIVSVRAQIPLPLASSGGLRAFVQYSLSYYPSFHTNFDFLVLYPDGAAFGDLPYAPMPRFDPMTLGRMLNPRDVGRWHLNGPYSKSQTLTVTFPNRTLTLHRDPQGWRENPRTDKDSPYDTYYPVTAAPRRLLTGVWRNSEFGMAGTVGGPAPVVAGGADNDLNLRSDGTFIGARQSFFTASGDMGGVSGGMHSTTAGHWRLDGVLLSTELNGSRTVRLAFLLPHFSTPKGEVEDMMLNNARWERPKAP